MPVVGDVVLTPFPFTDLSASKIRPAVVLADVGMSDWTLCEITSSRQARDRSIEISLRDLEEGTLINRSWARPDRLMTLNESIFRYTIGHLTHSKRDEILAAVRRLF